MAISLGTATLSKMYLGVSEITKAYLGATQIFGGTTVDTYAANGISPEFVADFANNYYRVASNDSTFASALTFSRSGNATMVDSDGLIKWAPHNRFENSVTGAVSGPWNVARVSGLPDPDGGNNAFSIASSDGIGTGNYRQIYSGTGLSGLWVTGAWLRLQSGSVDHVSFRAANDSAADAHAGVDLDNRLDGTWKYFEANPIDVSSNARFGIVVFPGTVLEVYAPRYFRSDLGGMVNNPETSNSYVPTTGTARYLSRLGHHVYNGSSYVNEGLLIESEARTNLVTYSEDFTNTDWDRGSAATVTDNYANSPTGNLTATRVQFPAQGSTFLFVRQSGYVVGETYTLSLYVKATSANSNFDIYRIFPPISGTLNTLGTQVATSEWQRFEYTFIATAESGDIGINNGDDSYASDILIWGAQVEAGSKASSYIPTAGSTVTRAADSLTSAAANLPYSATAMSIQAEGKAVGDTLTPIRWYADANNYITQEINTSDFSFEQANGGVVDTVTGGTYANDFTIASRHGSTFINGASSGTALTADTTPTALPDLSSSDIDLGQTYMGTIRQVRLWDQDIGDAGIEEATSGAEFSPLSLFASSEEGAWYDPSDLTSLAQNSDGTGAVTVGDPVGYMADKSGNGNHATQATAASRPILRQTVGGEYYLEFDGVDDYFSTASIDFTSTDEMSIFGGWTRESNPAGGVKYEFSTTWTSSTGTFILASDSSGNLDPGSRGTLTVQANDTTVQSVPSTYITSALSKISTDQLDLRVNGVLTSSLSTNQGTGNYSSNPLFIGARSGPVFEFEGKIFGLIIRGKSSTTDEINQTEAYLADKSGVTL